MHVRPYLVHCRTEAERWLFGKLGHIGIPPKDKRTTLTQAFMRKEGANETRKSGNGAVLVKRSAFRGKNNRPVDVVRKVLDVLY